MTTTYHQPPDKRPTTLVRNQYWHGKLMGVQDFQREQRYVRSLQQAMARLTVGCGVLCGLAVSRTGDTAIAVEGGGAIDGDGKLILVTRDHEFDDIRTWMCGADPDNPGTFELCLIHHDCPTLPTPALVTDCDTRLECKPSAIEERYRFEARPIDARSECDELCEGCDRRLEPGRRCRRDCGDCVPLAQFEWTGSRIASLTMEHRAEVPSNRELYELLMCTQGGCEPTAVVAPRLVDMWPRPGSTLNRQGSPSAWALWRYRPRVELTFDRPIDVERVGDPDDWLRVWAIFGDDADPTCERIRLRYLSQIDGKACGAHTIVLDFVDFSFDIPPGSSQDQPAVTVLVQALSNDNTGPAGATPVSLPAHIQYAGTSLTPDALHDLWRGDVCPPNPISELVPDSLPECFSDGYDGGLLHAAFRIFPVVQEQHVTAVYPYNGERVSSRQLPPIEISMAGDVPSDLEPRAWLIEDGGTHRSLSLTRASDPNRPLALRRFEGSFDGTLRQELANTARWDVEVSNPRPGKVVVLVPSELAGDHVGAFRGACLSDAEARSIWDGKFTPAMYPRVRPSARRMPRAGEAGRWIHWTYAWEGSRS